MLKLTAFLESIESVKINIGIEITLRLIRHRFYWFPKLQLRRQRSRSLVAVRLLRQSKH